MAIQSRYFGLFCFPISIIRVTAVAIAAFIITALAAYFLGSIPTGFLMGKARGIDIRKLGSGNIGATNVLRHLGTPAGIAVLLADALKGWVAVALVATSIGNWLHPGGGPLEAQWLRLTAGFVAVLGHNYTCWLRFKGGKGIATSAGVLLALVPSSLAVILGVWIVVFALTRYVSLASICGSFTLPFATWFIYRNGTLTVITAAMTALAIYKHRSNIQRLLEGTEHRIGKRKPAAIPEPKP